MEPEEINPHPDFLKGFNDGYILAQNIPSLAEELSKAVSDTERSEGFRQGRSQYMLEQQKERYPDWLTKTRLRDNDSKDKGDLEPEKE